MLHLSQRHDLALSLIAIGLYGPQKVDLKQNMNVYLLNLHTLNLQCKRILEASSIPCDPTRELASLVLLREALERNLLEASSLPEPLLLIAKMASDPQFAMRLMTEPEEGMELILELTPTLAEAAAEILTEIQASLLAMPEALQ
jgi:hypothetical protein